MSPPHTDFDAAVETAIESDPRIDREFVRVVTDGPSPVVLVGVVHDHPASIARVEKLIDQVEPDLIAVELPDVLVPEVADPERTFGGEMAAAVSAAPGTPAVGIDVPGQGTGRALLAEGRHRDVTLGTVVQSVRSLGTMTARTVSGRLARLWPSVLPSLDALEYGHEYGLESEASPRRQADNELAHLHRSRSLFETFEPPPATAFLDAVRERQMANRIERLRQKGSVAAVVGHEHLGSVGTALRTDEA